MSELEHAKADCIGVARETLYCPFSCGKEHGEGGENEVNAGISTGLLYVQHSWL